MRRLTRWIRNRSGGKDQRFPVWDRPKWKEALRFHPHNEELTRKLEEIEDKISTLEEVEKHVRRKYGKGGEPDEEELLQWAKTAGSGMCPGQWEDLDRLRKLRSEKFEILRQNLPDKGIPSGEPDLSPPVVLNGWWCVIVGISGYSGITTRLPGARPDAEAVYKYLVNKLDVPKDNIQLLLDDDATRDNILSTLSSHLLTNPKIIEGDRRLFYFAGHGTAYEASECFAKGPARAGAIEAICPVDRGKLDDDQVVYDISDRELNEFLKAVNAKWGPDTVVIFDCCHSGSAVRDIRQNGSSSEECINNDRCTTRAAAPLQNAVQGMLLAAERNHRWDNRFVLDANWRPDMQTHVMLAACRGDEQAVEFGGGGVFTKALLRALTELQPGDCSWQDLLPKIGKLWLQTPQVLGLKKSKLWFENRSRF